MFKIKLILLTFVNFSGKIFLYGKKDFLFLAIRFTKLH